MLQYTPARCAEFVTSTSPYLFFFYGSGDHRDLHSFPTRRSSDLRSWTRLHSRSTSRRSSAPSTGPRSSDRKSTRLNSSHITISYAVFCLKKKNHTVRLEDTVQHLAQREPHQRTHISQRFSWIRTR